MSALRGLALVLAAGCAASAWADTAGERRAEMDYKLHCSGCHERDGAGHPSKGIPDFRGQVGHFLHWPEGRAFLMQVPGLMNAGLSDERAAAVTTWLVRAFAGASLPADFVAYTAEEAGRYREARPADIAGTRALLYRKIVEAGLPLQEAAPAPLSRQ